MTSGLQRLSQLASFHLHVFRAHNHRLLTQSSTRLRYNAQRRQHNSASNSPSSSVDRYYTAYEPTLSIETSDESSKVQVDEALDASSNVVTRAATVTLVGAPNAGKSSLSNALTQHRVSAVSRKVNTTRKCTTAVYTNDAQGAQLLLHDTPGVIERQFTQSLTGTRRRLSAEVWGSAAESDFSLFIVDASRGRRYWAYYAAIASQLGEIRANHHKQHDNLTCVDDSHNCVLVLNKADVTRPHVRLLAAQDFFRTSVTDFDRHFHPRVFMTSAYKGSGVDELREFLLHHAPKGEYHAEPGTHYLDDHLEIIREHVWEKLLHRIHQEVPYKCSFENDNFRVAPNGDIFVSEIIRAPSKATCYMIVGRGGSNLRWIRESAQDSASQVLERKVTIKLTVMPAKERHGHIDSSFE